MEVRPSGLRACAAMLFSVVLLAAGLACHKHSNGVPPGDFQISGYVTYTRKPLARDANGVPTGVSTDATTYQTNAAARGMTLRVFQRRPQDSDSFVTTYVWTEVAATTTDGNGYYQISGNILLGWPTVIELTSLMTQPLTPASTITVIADPQGVYSPLNITDRPIYVMRKDMAGNTVGDSTQVLNGNGDSVVNFNVGLTDTWIVAPPKWWQAELPTFPTASSTPPAPTVDAGSAILAILDSCWYFSDTYNNAVPSSTTSALDFHYVPGVSVKRGTFVEYNPLAFTQAYDGTGFHYFGAISGGGTVDGVVQPDDAYDVGALFPILGRNMITGQRKVNLIPTGVPAPSLAPDLALVEGMGDGMAATLLQSPYLAGAPTLIPGSTPPTASRYVAPRDIRDLSALSAAQIGVCSAPAIAALTWQLALTNTGITAPGKPTDWATIIPVNLNRFYTLLTPTLTTGVETVPSDCTNLYVQLARLEEAQSGTDNSNLAAFFTDSVLLNLLQPFNIPWTTAADADEPKYTANWGVDPNTLLTPFPGFNLSMGQAQQIDTYYLDAQGVEQVGRYYPNNSQAEVVYAMFALSRDATYDLKVATLPALPAGAAIEVVVDGNIREAYLFPATAGTTSFPLTLAGNASDLTTPRFHSVRIRMLSPNTLVAPTQVTLKLERTSS